MIRRPPRSTRTDTLFPYTTLFRSRYRQTVSQSGLESRDSYIVSRARVPSAPSSPNMLIYAAMALVGGPGIGVLLVVLLQLLERGLETSDAIEGTLRSEEHTSELQSLMRISYAVFCLTKK